MTTSRKTFLRWSKLAVLPLLFNASETLTAPRTPGAEFEVSGFVEVRTFKQEKLILTSVRDFRVNVRNNGYCLRLNPSQGDRGIEYWEYAYDGTNDYSFVKFQHNVKTKSINDATLSISNEREPSNFEGANFGPVWLAYCANRLFTNGRPTYLRTFTPSSDVRTVNFFKTIRFRAEAEVDDTPPQLLRRYADFYDSDQNGEAWVTQLPKEYISGRSNSTFRAL